ncbi:hypothetical protein CH063_13622 [Colletotrichum higginsianum]|uniref:Uncharacterized protein n=1 Tax=Colletotrichum higginsianum (strain IMI 349063) TaxID=759273 RepID=H1VV60_COLHI|nr:hypothetical protein CH63R_14384 [Colletotrichum higginsianum IMI 349063]OBR02083.1 hypothetical protein CH63R_14384 [Colletotrichum higginsianum IMI 349063]CCF44119.1 hypothetical protein CH063_13622 [Colletotrichum higginsianum]
MKSPTLLFVFVSTALAVRVCRCTLDGNFSHEDTVSTCKVFKGRMRAKYCETNTPLDKWNEMCLHEGNCWNQST